MDERYMKSSRKKSSTKELESRKLLLIRDLSADGGPAAESGAAGARGKSSDEVPGLSAFLRRGVTKQEYTNATTSGLVNASSCEWDMELIRKLGFPEKLFTPLSMPGSVVGPLRQEIADEVGFTCSVVLPATHDTGSAVMSVPSDAEDTL